MDSKAEDLVPQQQQGGHHDVESCFTCDSIEEARELFPRLRERFFNISCWDEYAGKLMANFELHNASGNPKAGMPATGDCIKIDIPGPGTNSGSGFDWVCIEQIEEKENELAAIVVKPQGDPRNADEKVAHFYEDQARSVFVIERDANLLKASVHGRNEIPNTTDVSFLDKIRNALIGHTAIAGFGEIQWKLLADGLLKLKEDGKNETTS